VVAYDLGTCDGHSAYQREEWSFPHYGETFAPASARWNLCTGKRLSQAPPAGPVYCPRASSPHGSSGSVTCAELPVIEALVGGADHEGHSAKWVSHGWICGTDLNVGRNPRTVNCQSGNSKDVNFKI
jgi:hypothetical protein